MLKAETRLITLTTDFGAADWFVGTMKGVIARIAPHAKVVDITQEIPAGDIRAGAFVLAASCRFFPKGTIHVVVVDPGVGSARKAIAIRTGDYVLMGPDNGVLSWALRNERVLEMRYLENEKLFLHPVSRTFHGRDVFAPVAAHLSSQGVKFNRLGNLAKDYVRLIWQETKNFEDRIEGEVIYVDRFGNAITNIGADAMLRLGLARKRVFFGKKQICTVSEYYQSVPHGTAVAVIGSSDLLEIAINGGSASETLGLRPSTAIKVK